MKLLVGLGNYGSKYDGTRHNLGWMGLVDWIRRQGESSFRRQDKNSAMFFSRNDVGCVFPETYMNRSGEAVQLFLAELKIDPKDMLVLHDDLDLPPLSFRLKLGGGPGGHNGLRSIDTHCSNNYWRLRMGIGKPDHPSFKIENFVLSKFGPEEMKGWTDLLPSVHEAIDFFLTGKPEMAMNKFNRKTEGRSGEAATKEKKNGT